MISLKSLCVVCCYGLSGVCLAGSAGAAATSASIHGVAFNAFDGLLFNDDIIQGLVDEPQFFGDAGVFTNPGDLGWHPANTNPADQLPIFTDGLGGIRTLSGLLNENFAGNGVDEPLSGAPVKVIEYVLDTPSDIGRINILTGNRNNSDGRIFMTTSILYSTDGGNNFESLGYFQSDPSGVINNEVTPVAPFDPARATTFTSIFDNTTTTMLSGVTNIEFSFYAVDADTLGLHGDPYDGVNPFTGIDDGISPAFVSPLVWEIDLLEPAAGVVGDYNGDGSVSLADYTVWRDNLGSAVAEGSGADGSFNGIVDADDYSIWRLYFSEVTAPFTVASQAAVPEPASWLLVTAALAAALVRRGA